MDLVQDKYTIEIDQVNPSEWSSLNERFDDSTIFQTWSYGALKYGAKRLTHVVMRRHGEVVAAGQGCVVKMPALKTGIVHFSWGPMWRVRGRKPDLGVLRAMTAAMFREYASARGLMVRIRSYEVRDAADSSPISSVFAANGFHQAPGYHYRTMRVDLSRPLEELRQRFSGSWRRHLRAAEKKQFTIIQGSGDDLFQRFAALHDEMHSRKRLVAYNPDIALYQAMQKNLPDRLKMCVMICECEGEAVAANVVSAMGDTGSYLFGCSSDRAVRENLRGAYLLHWRSMEWLQAQGYRWYDLKGYEPERYPGVSHFKQGTRGEIVSFSEFNGCVNTLSIASVKCGDMLLKLARETNNLRKKIRTSQVLIRGIK